jgi:putative flippase GtrA
VTAAFSRTELRQFVRFVLVGVLNTAFGYGIYGLFLWVGVGLPLSLLGATVLGVLFNFVTTGRLVFRDFAWHRLPAYLVTYALLWLVGTGGIGWLARQRPYAWVASQVTFLERWPRGWTPLALEQFTAGVLFLPVSTLLTYLLLRTFVHTAAGPRHR